MGVQQDFINKIGPLIQKYAKQYEYPLCSPIIAQACIESRYGQSGLAKYHNYFGLKCGSSWSGKKVRLKTKEEYQKGVLTEIYADFRAYNNMSDGVKGYFDFISTKRYANLKTAMTPQQYLQFISADGFATSSTYVNTCMKAVNSNNLMQFDKPVEIRNEVYTAKVTASQLNVRDSYSETANVLFKVPKNMTLKIIQESDNGWARIDDITGWVSKQYLRKI